MVTTARRRGYGDDSIYFDAVKQRWTGAISLGYIPDCKRHVRRKVTGKAKTEVKDKLKAANSWRWSQPAREAVSLPVRRLTARPGAL
jgi:hypothetical protein